MMSNTAMMNHLDFMFPKKLNKIKKIMANIVCHDTINIRQNKILQVNKIFIIIYSSQIFV